MREAHEKSFPTEKRNEIIQSDTAHTKYTKGIRPKTIADGLRFPRASTERVGIQLSSCHRGRSRCFAAVMSAAVQLFHRDLGGAGNPPLVILHGMLGSSRNWQTVGRDLSAQYHVYALDLRNHGGSPHAAEMSYEAMMADVLAWLECATDRACDIDRPFHGRESSDAAGLSSSAASSSV